MYANKILAIEDPAERAAYVAEKIAEYEADVDLMRLAADMVIDAIVQPEDLRTEIILRLSMATGRSRHFSDKRHGITPG